MREETILNYQNLVYKILSHYRNLYNYNRDFEEDYFHDGMVALIQAYDTYKDDNNVKFITYASRCIHNKYKDIFKKKSFNEEPLDLQIKDDLYLLDIITKKITQKNLAKIINCTQSCIAKKHNKILNLIKEYLEY